MSGVIRTEDELKRSIADFFRVMRDVDNGEVSLRVEVPFADHEPMRALADTVNAIVGRLAGIREEARAYQRDIDGQLSTIEKQRAAIKELSTPMIEVWACVLCVPIVGVIDSGRAADMTSALLSTVVEKMVRFTIIDITGIEAMDTRATDHFLRMARSVRLLGAECVLSGINPNVARSIVHMGVDLSGIGTYRSLRDALQAYVRRQQKQKDKRDGNGHEAQNGHAGTNGAGGEKE